MALESTPEILAWWVARRPSDLQPRPPCQQGAAIDASRQSDPLQRPQLQKLLHIPESNPESQMRKSVVRPYVGSPQRQEPRCPDGAALPRLLAERTDKSILKKTLHKRSQRWVTASCRKEYVTVDGPRLPMADFEQSAGSYAPITREARYSTLWNRGGSVGHGSGAAPATVGAAGQQR